MGRRCAVFIPAFIDTDELLQMYETFKTCRFDFSNEIVLMDMSPEWNKDEKLMKYCADNNIKHLGYSDNCSRTLDEVSRDFVINKNYDYFLWLHADMRFDHPDWIDCLMDFFERHVEAGKISATNHNWVADPQDRRGNGAPEMLSAECIRRLVNKYGYVWDGKYEGAGWGGDIDVNRRVVGTGLQVWVVGASKVWHKTRGNRGRFNLDDQDRRNANYYHSKWNDSNMEWV